MTIPPLFKQLYQQHKKLSEEVKFLRAVIVPENYALENIPILNAIEPILHEMLGLIEEIKQSERKRNPGRHLPGDPLAG